MPPLTKTIPTMNWIKAIQQWRQLPLATRAEIHLRRIPHHTATSMAMEGEPIEEALIREQLASRYPQVSMAKPPSDP